MLMTSLDGLSFQFYSARTLEPLEAQFELLAGLGYTKVEPYGGLLNDPRRLKNELEAHWAFRRFTLQRHRLASEMAAKPSGPRSGD
jgi:hypothetical protein